MERRLRWLKKFSSKELILQEKIGQEYHDGCGHVDEILKWVDVPTAVVMNEEGDIVECWVKL